MNPTTERSIQAVVLAAAMALTGTVATSSSLPEEQAGAVLDNHRIHIEALRGAVERLDACCLAKPPATPVLPGGPGQDVPPPVLPPPGDEPAEESDALPEADVEESPSPDTTEDAQEAPENAPDNADPTPAPPEAPQPLLPPLPVQGWPPTP